MSTTSLSTRKLFKEPDMPPPTGGCAWCGTMPAEVYEIEPPITAKEPGTGRPIVKRVARTALACAHHRENFDADKKAAAVRREAERRRKQEAKGIRVR